MITVATLLWATNDRSQPFSAMYDETWVTRLLFGFHRNLTQPFRFICYVDRLRPELDAFDVEQRPLSNPRPGYGDCLQPYEMNEPMILVGLDTVITGNVDHLADYALTADTLALPRDPYAPHRACNGVALVPAGHDWIWREWDGSTDDMTRARQAEHVFIDDLWPGHVVSFKGSVKANGLGDARIVYFHGLEKPHQLGDVPWVQEHWR